MAPEERAESRYLVVVDPSGSPKDPIEHAIRSARDEARDGRGDVSVLVVADGRGSSAERAKAAVERAVSALEPTGLETRVAVLSGEVGTEPGDALVDLAGTDAVTTVVIDPATCLSPEALRERFGAATVERAPEPAPPARRRLVHPAGLRDSATLFGLSYLFYLAIGGFVGGPDLATGAISAAVVTVVFGQVAFAEVPRLARTGPRLARFVLFVPRLFLEIARANVALAAVILDPRLPIEPSMRTVETDTSDGLERMVLANSITLTPGTLVVDVRGREFTVHSLTASSRTDLEGGRLARYVAWVFHGRSSDPDGGDGE